MSLVDFLRNHVFRLFELISGPDGTMALLENFKTNIKTVAFDVIEQQLDDLKTSGVLVLKDFPDRALTIFGEDILIAQIVQNLIENVWKNSQAKVLKICFTSDIENNRVQALFLDNGIGLTDQFSFGGGLKTVRDNARACCGEFEIHNLSPSDHYYSEGFRTIAKVVLPMLA